MVSRKWGSASGRGSHVAECARERGTEMENSISAVQAKKQGLRTLVPTERRAQMSKGQET